MKKETEKNEKENQMYKVYEMKDQLTESIKNLEGLIAQHALLLDVIKEANKPELKPLTTSIPKTIDVYAGQIKKLTEKLQLCNRIIYLYENKVSTQADELLSFLFDLFF